MKFISSVFLLVFSTSAQNGPIDRSQCKSCIDQGKTVCLTGSYENTNFDVSWCCPGDKFNIFNSVCMGTRSYFYCASTKPTI